MQGNQWEERGPGAKSNQASGMWRSYTMTSRSGEEMEKTLDMQTYMACPSDTGKWSSFTSFIIYIYIYAYYPYIYIHSFYFMISLSTCHLSLLFGWFGSSMGFTVSINQGTVVFIDQAITTVPTHSPLAMELTLHKPEVLERTKWSNIKSQRKGQKELPSGVIWCYIVIGSWLYVYIYIYYRILCVQFNTVSCSCHLLSQMFPLASSYHVIPTSTQRKLWKVPTGHSTRCHLRSSGEANEKKTDSSFYSSDLKSRLKKTSPWFERIHQFQTKIIMTIMIYHDCIWIQLIIHVVLNCFFILAPKILEMPVDKGVCPGPGHPLPSLTPGGMLHWVPRIIAKKLVLFHTRIGWNLFVCETVWMHPPVLSWGP